MSGTLMASFKSQLLTKLQANGTLSSIQVSYGEPSAPRRECVYLGDIINNRHSPESLSTGRRRRIEEFEVEVFISVNSKPRSQPQDSETRAVVLADAVETVIVEDPQLGNLSGLLYCEVSSMQMSTVETGDGPLTIITINVQAKARLA
jgi:hypothetical protein